MLQLVAVSAPVRIDDMPLPTNLAILEMVPAIGVAVFF
jgi:hypothetical protein